MSKSTARSGADVTPRIAEFIDVASRLIAERGYDRTSVRDIAQAMDLTSGSMFYHFKNKHDLLEAVIGKGIRDGMEFMRVALERETGGPLARFLVLVQAHLQAVHGELRHVHRVWNQEWSRLSPEARADLRPLNEQYRNIWRETLIVLHAAGHLRSDPAFVRHLLLPALNWTTVWAHSDDDSTRRALAEQICAAVLNLSVAELRDATERERAAAS